jgi:protein TonB
MQAVTDSISISPATADSPADATAAPMSLASVAVLLPPTLPTITRGELAGLVAAICAHAIVIAAMLDRHGSIGAEGTKIDAISVDVVTLAEVSASRPPPPTAMRLETTGTMAVRDGASPAEPQQPSPDARAAVSEAKPDAAAPADIIVPDAERKPDPPDPDSTAPVIAPDRATGKAIEPVPELRQAVTEPQPSLDNAIPAEALLAAPDGGAAAAPQPTQRLAAVEADAAAGRRDAYGQAVFDTLRANPPAFVPGASGRVKIEFRIEQDGGPASVRVLETSGDQRMEIAALSAVRGVRFPRPPPGLNGSDLIFTVPFSFRSDAADK